MGIAVVRTSSRGDVVDLWHLVVQERDCLGVNLSLGGDGHVPVVGLVGGRGEALDLSGAKHLCGHNHLVVGGGVGLLELAGHVPIVFEVLSNCNDSCATSNRTFSRLKIH